MSVRRYFWDKIGSLGCYLTNLSWKKMYREYKYSRKSLK
jgi:hypothetical protein